MVWLECGCAGASSARGLYGHGLKSAPALASLCVHHNALVAMLCPSNSGSAAAYAISRPCTMLLQCEWMHPCTYAPIHPPPQI